jgi:hypothetical protein
MLYAMDVTLDFFTTQVLDELTHQRCDAGKVVGGDLVRTSVS